MTLHHEIKTALDPSYLRRLVSYPLIKPILASDWYSPRENVPGAAKVIEFSMDAPPHSTAAITQLLANVFDQPTYAFLVLHKGKLVVEQYQNYSRQGYSNSMSMMKTVLALLIGIAEADGRLAVETPAAEWLPEWRHDRRRHIRIADLLSMQSGLRSDLSVPGRHLVPDILPLFMGTEVKRFALSAPAVAEPGAYWEYNNFNSQVLGIVLERATGRRYPSYLAEKLWQPLGCADAQVYLDQPSGQTRTFTGLFANPHDWLKLAELIRLRGAYCGRQIVPVSWLERMEQPRNADADYGYHIWLKAHRKPQVRGIPMAEHFFASEDFIDPDTLYLEGMHQQTAFISRAHQLVALRIGEKPKKARWDGSDLFNTLLREFS